MMMAIANLDKLVLDGKPFFGPVPLAEFSEVLGQPTTIESGPPAPYGHRNNQIHLYDALGMYLHEHHATRLIGQVSFVLDPAEVVFPVERPFSGELLVGDTKVYPGMRERDYPNPASVVLYSVLPGIWKAEGADLVIYLDTKGRKNRMGRRSKIRHVVSVSVCFKKSHLL